MKRFVCASFVAISCAVVVAASPHYKKDGKPTCAIAGDGSSSCTSGEVAGLGNENVLVVVTVNGIAGTLCHNPGNSLEVPGQNPAEGSASAGVFIDSSQIKNGTLVIPPITTVLLFFRHQRRNK